MTGNKKNNLAVVDMGTSNTRLSLLDAGGAILAAAKGPFGVKDHAAGGDRTVLVEGLRGLLDKALSRSGLGRESISMMICAGMITSEIGLQELPHLLAPAGVQDLAENAKVLDMPEIGPMPLVFVPGIKNQVSGEPYQALNSLDFMRGEETQVTGAMDLYGIQAPASFIFLSSHTKLVDVDEKGRITGSFTTLSGQIFDYLRFQSLLASSLPDDEPEHLPHDALKKGIQAGLDHGILRAGLLVRFMDTLVKTSPEDRFALLEGIILASDLRAFQSCRFDLRPNVYLLGNRLRAEAYKASMGEFMKNESTYHYLGENSMDDAAIRGAVLIAGLRAKAGLSN